MELLCDGDFRYTLQMERSGSRFAAHVLRLRRPPGDARLPRVAVRYDLPETFVSSADAHHAGLAIAERMVAGELRAFVPELKKRVKEYEVIASALYQLQDRKWEPALKITSRRPTNKGAQQEFNDEQTPLQRNLCPTPERARDYALEYGERLVLGAVPGLRI